MSSINNELEMLHYLTGHLESLTNKGDIVSASNMRDFAESSVAVKRYVESVARRSNVRFASDNYYLFTGEIYEKVSVALLDKAVEEWLFACGVSSKVMHYSTKKFQESVRKVVFLENKLVPRFHLKAFNNGVVDFTDGVLRPFSPEHHVIFRHPYNYDPKAKCPMWNSFLRTVLPEKESRLILQMYLGLCTYDRGTMVDKVENCLMLCGMGSNGKSVIHETIVGIFGRENVSTLGLLSLIKGGDEKLRNIAQLDGKIVNMCPEVQAKDISGYEDAFKALCSGEPQYGRNIGGKIFKIYNVPWMIFNMNNLPKASDSSYGYFRRQLYVMFQQVIPEEMQNKHLANDLKEEYPGILNWIVRGARYLRQRKFVFPKSDNSERQRYVVMGENNVTLSWVFARNLRFCKNGMNDTYELIPSKVMYDDMCKYAEKNGFNPVTEQMFGRNLLKLGLKRKRTSNCTYYEVYGMTEDYLARTEPPYVADIKFRKDEADKDVDYDNEDIN